MAFIVVLTSAADADDPRAADADDPRAADADDPCAADADDPSADAPLSSLPPPICCVTSVNPSMYFSKYALPKLIIVLFLSFFIKGKAKRNV